MLRRGSVVVVDLDPTVGHEQRGIRPAIVVSPASIGRLPLRIVVPVTGWRSQYAVVPWLVLVKLSAQNGLSKDSAADCFQVKSISLNRFQKCLGLVTADQIEEISAAIALCVDA